MEAPVVIGIDPGSVRTGWGVVKQEAGGFRLVDCGIIRTMAGAEGGADFSARLARIYRELVECLRRTRPQEAAIEQVFQYKNVASALKLGQARGVAVAACASLEIPVSDLAPTLVKQTVVGTGRAEKEQVAFMVKRMLGLGHEELPLDTTDALGIAITHLVQRRFKARIAGA